MIPSKPQQQKGFTLIELMIVIAIIGILAAIALPMYQNYIAKSQITRVYYEVASTRSAVENIIGNGNTPTTQSQLDGQKSKFGGVYEYIGIEKDDPQSNLMQIADVDIESDPQAELSIIAEFSSEAFVGIQGLKLSMVRKRTGWACIVDPSAPNVSSWKNSFLPTGCTVGKIANIKKTPTP